MTHSRFVKVVFVLAVALVAVQAASANGGFYEAKVLEPAASYVAKKPVAVWCALSPGAWAAHEVERGLNGEADGSAPVGGTEVFLSQNVCPLLRQARRLGPPSLFNLPPTAESIELLTHESIHARGERDEGVTDCAAMHEMPGVAVRFFRVKAGKQLRTLMGDAWSWHDGAPPQYRTVC